MAPVTPKLDQSVEELLLEMTTHEMLDDVRLFDVDMESSDLPTENGREESKQEISVKGGGGGGRGGADDRQMMNSQTLKPPPKPPRFRKAEVATR